MIKTLHNVLKFLYFSNNKNIGKYTEFSRLDVTAITSENTLKKNHNLELRFFFKCILLSELFTPTFKSLMGIYIFFIYVTCTFDFEMDFGV